MTTARKVWVDATSYSSGATKRIPRVWKLGAHPHELTVHRYIGEVGWFVSCFPLGIDRVPLTKADPDEAKKEAVKQASERLAAIVEAYARLGVKP